MNLLLRAFKHVLYGGNRLETAINSGIKDHTYSILKLLEEQVNYHTLDQRTGTSAYSYI